MCAAVYARKELGITDRFAFLSPCIAKKIEIEDPVNKGLVQYNVTFNHLMKIVREKQIYGDPVSEEVEYGLGYIRCPAASRIMSDGFSETGLSYAR